MTPEERLIRIETLLEGISSALKRDTYRLDIIEKEVHGIDGGNGLKSRVARLEALSPSKKQVGIFGSLLAAIVVTIQAALQVLNG